jgi:hypothetical protein
MDNISSTNSRGPICMFRKNNKLLIVILKEMMKDVSLEKLRGKWVITSIWVC